MMKKQINIISTGIFLILFVDAEKELVPKLPFISTSVYHYFKIKKKNAHAWQ